ncbi:leucine-rich repeat-containing protein 63 [Sorex araneus]|uniref:leucine-rich repeat-containing protein 63 n=1 Tax=Sorex araneus TaxID=42254 RepID=UPI00243359A7|nr:leucine-rich repeat-containing protein 63 [Sorex araneus]
MALISLTDASVFTSFAKVEGEIFGVIKKIPAFMNGMNDLIKQPPEKSLALMTYEDTYLVLIKMECKVRLLRRPLPPKSPKRPWSKTPEVKTVALPKEFIQDTTAHFEKQATGFESGTMLSYMGSTNQPQYHVHIQNIVFKHPESERMAKTSAPSKSTKSVHWNIPDTSLHPIFFGDIPEDSTLSLKLRSYKKASRRRASPKLRHDLAVKTHKDSEKISVYVLKPTNFSPKFNISPFYDSAPASIPYRYLPKIMAFGIKPHLVPTMEEITPWSRYTQRRGAIFLNINNFADAISLPKPKLPRIPQKQMYLETLVMKEETEAHVPKSFKSYVSKISKFINTRGLHEISGKLDESTSYAVHGEGFKMFKTIAATQYETVLAMTNLAIHNCRLFRRNALNLKGFFIINCPDLTPLAHQLVYINLSYNDLTNFPAEVFCVKNLQVLLLRNNPIKEIPSAIQQLKFLRILDMAFNLLTSLPAGLFNLYRLRNLDIAYNTITTLPSDIQKLRSLEKLIVDGNELVTFPPAILRLNLKKISFENNFTHHVFWIQTLPTIFKPQPLTQIAALIFLKNKLHLYYGDIPEIAQHLRWTSTCDLCLGPKFGEGFTTIRTCNIFGGKNLPIMFHVCSPSCYDYLRKGGSIFNKSIVFKDWSKVWDRNDSTGGKILHSSDQSFISAMSKSEHYTQIYE